MNVDSFGQFLNEAGRINLLTPEEEIYLGKSVQAMLALLRDKPDGPYGKLQMATLRRGKRAKERMVKANLRLVVMISRKYSHKNPNSGITIEDLVQEGSIGLMRAVEKYDPTRGYKFSTYAFWWIKQAITRYLHQKSRMIRPPHHIAEKIFQINRVTHDLCNTLGRRPTMDELATGLGLSRDEFDLMRTRASGVRSLDELVVEDGNSLLNVICNNETNAQHLSDLNESLHLEHLDACIKQLDDKEQQMLILRYGLNGHPQHTYIEIAKQYNLSRERVRQYVERSQRKLRMLMSANQLAAEPLTHPLYKTWTLAGVA
jgi:RNA polymerase primary sigma factor